MKPILTRLALYPAPVRIIAFLLLVVGVWLPFAAPIALLVRDANQVTIFTMSLLFVAFLLLIRVWGKRVQGDRRIFQTYGLVFSKQNGRELLLGLAIGLLSLFFLFGVQSSLGWVEWQAFAPSLRIGLEGGVMALGIGFAEELVFRGWIYDELRRDYSPKTVLWADSLIFACLHFIKSPAEIIRTFPQFPGLVLLGLALVWAKRSTAVPRPVADPRCPQGRLGLAIGLHAGLVWGYYMVNVGNLIRYSSRVPMLLTGIDRNPLSGAIGLLFLGGLASLMAWQSRRGSFFFDR
ncbi:type II CAAX endopeptidase family protein [Leptolyngbya sp. FACHB-711]|uniref:CPBP family intramembrane glutamic endopeptidase n=1 Tax=unclassified Leptolyngbya TaxID=2650499 RepID=UPI001683539A|nr:type II CAAX endopeptidase family protein [Leptolyngbya sp. FACHB-711]MBD1848871.1 CPBP family intramembrane metalloprotease [Cyanobacteria bacterium FACHB-502]MBD2025312.1 CPBP family intramembrane metalloprotease [Leptolyngbya sp. FACHB-711]